MKAPFVKGGALTSKPMETFQDYAKTRRRIDQIQDDGLRDRLKLGQTVGMRRHECMEWKEISRSFGLSVLHLRECYYTFLDWRDGWKHTEHRELAI